MKQPELGLRIEAIRKRKGLTQEELVARCNINVRTLQRIENGEVTPRSYTIKTLLSALDEDLESLRETGPQGGEILLGVTQRESKSVHVLLTMALISGVLYLITSSLEGAVDYFRFYDGQLILGRAGSVVLKLASMLCYGLFIYGFLIFGRLLKIYLMKIASVLLLVAMTLFYLYDIVSFFNEFLEFEVVLLAEAISLGALGLLFGISILKAPTPFRPLNLFAGGMEVLASFMLLTVILSLVGWILQLPVIILEVLLLYKLGIMVKNKI